MVGPRHLAAWSSRPSCEKHTAVVAQANDLRRRSRLQAPKGAQFAVGGVPMRKATIIVVVGEARRAGSVLTHVANSDVGPVASRVRGRVVIRNVDGGCGQVDA